MGNACEHLPMRVLSYCLMPNHFHLALWPHHDGDLGRWMHWLLNAHVRRYHQHYHSSGHLWQGRFKAFPIQHDDHLLTVPSPTLSVGIVPLVKRLKSSGAVPL